MNLIKYRPVTGSLLGWDLDRVLDNIFSDTVWSTATAHPRVDVKEDDNQFTVEADLPGLTEKDIDVTVEGDLLTFSLKQTEEKKEEEDSYIIRERQHMSFSRSFTLPKNIDREKIKANFKNGVLTLVLPKTPEAKPKQIQVKQE